MTFNYQIFIQRLRQPISIALIVIVVIAALGGFWLWYQNYQWPTYKDSNYGLQFTYSRAWGKPKISEHKTLIGKSYTLNFVPSKTKSTSSPVSVVFQSADSKLYLCNQDDKDCPPPQTLTKDAILKRLAQDKKGLLVYGSDSYSILLTDPKDGLASMVNIFRIVDLPKINVTALHASYTIPAALNSSINCSTTSLATDKKSSCVTKQQYEELDKTLRSFKAR